MADAQKGKGEDDAAGFEALEQDYQGVRHRVPPPSPHAFPPGGASGPPRGEARGMPAPGRGMGSRRTRRDTARGPARAGREAPAVSAKERNPSG